MANGIDIESLEKRGSTGGLRTAFLHCAAAAALMLSSCAPPPPAPPEGMPEPYSGMRERIEDLDTTPLQGKRIVIDPGHGGRYAGAVGPTGLREADVNLGVALNLWGLLKDAGADATLTRHSDRTVAEGEDISLREDLIARSVIANAAEPHVFISIHHNSDIGVDPSINRIETYYKASDPGPSYDAARTLHTHLSFNINETRGGVIPGNYSVLRRCEFPAVLGEPSFISNPLVEARLKEADVQRMEAEAYFVGLVEYFSRGVPSLQRVEPADSVTQNAYPTISVLPDPGREGIGIDPASTRFTLDGVPRDVSHDPASGLITFTPVEPLGGGAHAVSARVRNLKGNWSAPLEFGFSVDTKPAHLVLTPEREIGEAQGVPFAIDARVYDVNMNPIADGTPVTFRSDTGAYPEISPLKDGKAVCYIVPPPGGSFSVEAHCGEAKMGFAADAAEEPDVASYRWFFARDASEGAPIAGATVALDQKLLGRSNRDGFVSFTTADQEGGLWRIRAPGYAWRPTETLPTGEAPFDSISAWTVNTLELDRAAGGLLHGHTIALDPEGGGDDRAGQGPSGTDASRINFEVASALATMIEDSGGRVVLTRERGAPASDLERLLIAETSGATRYIAISHRPSGTRPAPRIEHYPGSAAGISLAGSLALTAAQALDAPPPEIMESSRYSIRMTGSPAVFVNLVPLADRGTETFLSRPWNVLREAYAIYAGLLRHLAASEGLPEFLTVTVTLPEGGGPALGAKVTLDGYLDLLTNGDGEVPVSPIQDGEHALEISLPGHKTALETFHWPPDQPDKRITVELESE
jgi:N-acetylmuramoyl-L-alanine amidase